MGEHRQIDAGRVAVALVWGAKRKGVAPDIVFADTPAARRARLLAAIWLDRSFGRRLVAHVCQLPATNLISPSQWPRHGVSPEDVAAMLSELGEPGPPRERRSRSVVRGQTAPAPAPAPRVMRRARRLARTPATPAAERIDRLTPLTARKRRFCRWFIDAGWQHDDVAELFDVDAAELTAAFPSRLAA